MKMGLKIKFILTIVLLAVLGVIIQGMVSYFNSRNAIKESISLQITQISDSITQNITSRTERTQVDVANWARLPMYKIIFRKSGQSSGSKGIDSTENLSQKTENVQLVSRKSEYGFYEDFYVADKDGNIKASSNVDLIGKFSVAGKGYFKNAQANEATLFGPFKSEHAGNPVFSISYPIINSRDELLGIYIGVVDVSLFTSEYIENVKTGEEGNVFILDSEGNIIAHPDRSKIYSENQLDTKYGREMFSMGNGLMTYDSDGTEPVREMV